MTRETPAFPPAARRPGFTLVEVILAVGVIGIAIASLIGILTSTFQQVDDVLQTNRALTAAQGLVTALDNPRSILRDLSDAGGASANNTAANHLPSATDPDGGGVTLDNAAGDASNFEIAYRLLNQAATVETAVWLYVYERKAVRADLEVDGTDADQFQVNANPALVEVVRMGDDAFGPDLAAVRSIIGAPMRVRLTLSRLLVGQRVTLDTATGEPTTATYAAGNTLDPDPGKYALAHLPIVAEFFPHDYTAPADFKETETQPVLTQTIILNR